MTIIAEEKRPLSEVRGFIERRKRCGYVFKVSC